MTLPLAAQPTSPTPGLWLTADLYPKTVSAGSQPIRCCILAPKSSTGAITNDTERREILSVQDAEASHGIGNVGTLAYKAAKRRWPNALIDMLSPTPSAGSTASGSYEVSGTITAGYTGYWDIHGVLIEVPWNVGETPAQFHAKCVTFINRYTDRLFVTASVGTGPDRVVLSAKTAGPIGNDVRVGFRLAGGAGATVLTNTAALTGGNTEPDFSTALATIRGREYDYIGLCISNADAASTTGNLARLETHIDGISTGPSARLQQGIAAHTGLRTAGAVSSAARNSQIIELLNAQNARSLPCEYMGEELGDRAAQTALKYSANRIGREYSGLLVGSADPVSDHPSTAESDAALLAGLSCVGYADRSGQPYLIRAVTTYCATPQGAQVLPTDCNEVDAIYQYAKDLRAFLPVEFAGVKVARDSAGEEEPLPAGVVEERDIRAKITARTENFWIPKGVIDRAAFRASVANGELIARVNDTDETQVDIFVPAKPFKNCAKLGLYVAKTG